MKIVLSTLALSLFAIAAHAAPKVGDVAFFRGTWGADNISQEVKFTAWNGSQFTKVTTTTIGARPPATSSEQVDFNRTASDAAIDDLLRNCAARGGVAETVLVPAGSFPSCKVAASGGGFVWFGQVPFAVLWWNTTVDSKPLVLRLVSFTRGTGAP